MTSTAIQVSHLHKTFRGRSKALNDISLNIQAGEMVALIGASGSGKSTLIRHIAGLIVGDRSGASQLTVLDHQLQGAGRLARDIRRQRARIGVVFQQFNLVGRMTVLGNVLVGTLGHIPVWRGVLGLFSRSERLKAIRALARVGLAELATQRASTLSGGQQQRVAIARTLVQDAEIILADEPIASLDPESARRVMEILARINQEDGRTVLVSLHQVDFALKYCHRTVALQDGKICYDGPSCELTPDRLKALYGTTLADSDTGFPSLDPALLANLAAPTITHSTPAHPAVSVESV